MNRFLRAFKATLLLGAGCAAGTDGGQDGGFAGLWNSKSVAVGSEGHTDSFMGMIKASKMMAMELSGDGTARVCYMGQTQPTTWTLTDTGASFEMDEPCPISLKDGMLLLNLGGEMEILLEPASGVFEDLPAVGGQMVDEDDPAHGYALAGKIALYEGDWYGYTRIDSASGRFAALEGAVIKTVARFAFDESGACTPCIICDPAGIGEGRANYEFLYANLDDDTLSIGGYLMGEMLGGTALDFSAEEHNLITCGIAGGEESSFSGALYLRLWGRPWESEDGAPSCPGENYSAGKTFEEIASASGAEDIPEASNAAAGILHDAKNPDDGSGIRSAEAISGLWLSYPAEYENFADRFFHNADKSIEIQVYPYDAAELAELTEKLKGYDSSEHAKDYKHSQATAGCFEANLFEYTNLFFEDCYRRQYIVDFGEDIGQYRGIDLNVTVNNPSLFCAPEIQAVADSLRRSKD